jgi:hypothetical protein
MTDHKRQNIINAIQEYLEENESDIGEWTAGFLESIQEHLIGGGDLSPKQKDKIIDIVGNSWI